MKKKSLFKTVVIAALFAAGMSLYAQERIVFDPSLLTPSDSGYYVVGYDKLEGSVYVHYDSCSNEFQESHHFEADTLNGFYFQNGMVMPDCPSKDEPSKVSLGYMQLGKSSDLGTETEKLCALTCPPVANLDTLYLEVSPDNSPISAPDPRERHIYYYIEYSKDFGVTWEPNKIHDETLSKAGDKHIYTASGSFPVFDEMIAASKEGPVVLRIYTDPQPDKAPQRLRIHKVIITADRVSGLPEYTTDYEFFSIFNGVITATQGMINVYNTQGQLIGAGTSVYVKNGIYIVQAADGRTQKIMIQK